PWSAMPIVSATGQPCRAPIMQIRQGSNELDRTYSTERSSPVMLSEAKHLSADRDRPFASLRVTLYDCSNCQVLFFKIDPCLNKLIRPDRRGRFIGQSLSDSFVNLHYRARGHIMLFNVLIR